MLSKVHLNQLKNKEIKTNLDEKLIEDLAQRSTRDTTAENAGASGEGAVPTSTVQSTTSTREYGDNEDYLEAAVESSSPAGLSLAAGNSGVLQAGCATFMLCYCEGIKFYPLVLCRFRCCLFVLFFCFFFNYFLSLFERYNSGNVRTACSA